MLTVSIRKPDASAGGQSAGSRRRTSKAHACLVLIGLVGLTSGCLSRSAVVVEDLLLPVARPAPWLPRESDLAAARLAESALAASTVDQPDPSGEPTATESVETALIQLTRSVENSPAARLSFLAQDVRNSTLDDPIAYRNASRKLQWKWGLDPRLENRLDLIVNDDPIRLARQRQLDYWRRLWARTFNAVSQPLGSSVITGFVIAPFMLANSIIHYFAGFSNNEPLSATGRQALVLRKNFLAAHPETQWTDRLEKQIEQGTLLFEKTLALRRVRLAERTLATDQPTLASFHARAAISQLAAHPEANKRLRRRAEKTETRAEARRREIQRLRTMSLEASMPPPSLLEPELRLASWILAKPLRFESLDRELTRYAEAGGSADRIEFVRAIAQHENGLEVEARNQLERLTDRRITKSTMARHGQALADSDWQNPYRAFERLRRKAIRDELAWRLAGEWMRRPRYPNLPTPLAYLIDSPTIAMTLILAPVRALLSPFQGGPDFDRAPALAGYRYLSRFPSGANQPEVVEWLYEYESRHDRFGRALRLADLIPRIDAEERQELVEKTAEARRTTVEHVDRRDSRASILKGVAREFPDSEQGREAGLQARKEAKDSSSQHIRITKSFLLENPKVAGREGIGLNPRLLNGDPGDGELHPEGVVLRGGRTLEIRLIAEGKSDDDAHESRYRKIGKQRLKRIATSLDDVVHRNSLADLESTQTADANRDTYLERASLELTDAEDPRPTAESSFVYESLRERYGLVRGRDSLLPFDLVLRGSLGNFSLGAFPRWRAPKKTPDSFLYR